MKTYWKDAISSEVMHDSAKVHDVIRAVSLHDDVDCAMTAKEERLCLVTNYEHAAAALEYAASELRAKAKTWRNRAAMCK